MANLKKVVDRIKEQGVVPYTEHSPEQRKEFIARVECLNAVNINLGLILDNWPYIAAAIPDKKVNPKVHNQFKQLTKSLEDMISSAKMVNNRLLKILAVNTEAAEKIESYSWYNKEIISKLLRIPNERVDLALKVIDGLGGNESVQAESPEEYSKKMISFANQMIKKKGGSGRASKKDLETFLKTQ